MRKQARLAEPEIVAFRSVTKRYPGTLALDDVSFAVHAGEIHAVLGENGAGKSTLMGLLGGDILPDAGSIEVDGIPRRISSPHDAQQLGIGMVHQELLLCRAMSVAANLQLGREPARGGFVRRNALRRAAREALDAVGLDAPLDVPVERLSVAQRQQIVIARALSRRASIVIFDEPNSTLNEAESGRLFALIRRLRSEGTTILYVSHRLEEVLQLADRVTVLRDGRYVGTRHANDITRDELVRLMVGRQLNSAQNANPFVAKRALLTVRGLSSPGALTDVDFEIGEGEIVGAAGLEGSGKDRLARALFGVERGVTGEVSLDSRRLRLGTPAGSIRAGMAWIPADRRNEGIIGTMSVTANLIVSHLRPISRWSIIMRRAARALVDSWMRELDVHAADRGQRAATLSGGNQQKLVLARWLSRRPRLLLMEEPTAGVDVGAKADIYTAIQQHASAGNGVLVISSELPELLALASRILVFRAGRIAGCFAGVNVTQDRIGACAAGVDEPDRPLAPVGHTP